MFAADVTLHQAAIALLSSFIPGILQPHYIHGGTEEGKLIFVTPRAHIHGCNTVAL